MPVVLPVQVDVVGPHGQPAEDSGRPGPREVAAALGALVLGKAAQLVEELGQRQVRDEPDQRQPSAPPRGRRPRPPPRRMASSTSSTASSGYQRVSGRRRRSSRSRRNRALIESAFHSSRSPRSWRASLPPGSGSVAPRLAPVEKRALGIPRRAQVAVMGQVERAVGLWSGSQLSARRRRRSPEGRSVEDLGPPARGPRRGRGSGARAVAWRSRLRRAGPRSSSSARWRMPRPLRSRPTRAPAAARVFPCTAPDQTAAQARATAMPKATPATMSMAKCCFVRSAAVPRTSAQATPTPATVRHTPRRGGRACSRQQRGERDGDGQAHVTARDRAGGRVDGLNQRQQGPRGRLGPQTRGGWAEAAKTAAFASAQSIPVAATREKPSQRRVTATRAGSSSA